MDTINQKEILDKIKQEICRIHPILNPRKNDGTKETSVMEIYFNFEATYDNIPFTVIGFLDGNEHSRISTSTSYKLDGYINLEMFDQLISYLISQYPYISDFSIFSQSFSLNFTYPREIKNQEGISCDEIILNFFTRNKDFTPILNHYLSNILIQFTNELSRTSTFQYKYAEHCNNLQRKILNSLNEKEMDQMIETLPIEMKRELLQKLPSQYFLQFYQDHYNQEEKALVKKLIKNKTQPPFKLPKS